MSRYPTTDPIDQDHPDPHGFTALSEEAHDLTDVSRHMRSIGNVEAQLHEIDQVVAAERARIDDWAEQRRRTLNAKIEHHAQIVRSFHEMVIREDRRRKTLDTPYGRSKIVTPTKPVAFVDDRDAVTDWALASAPEIVKHSVNVSAVRKVAMIVTTDSGSAAVDPSTGEIIPGVSVSVPEPSWSYDTTPGEPL